MWWQILRQIFVHLWKSYPIFSKQIGEKCKLVDIKFTLNEQIYGRLLHFDQQLFVESVWMAAYNVVKSKHRVELYFV